MPQRACLKLCSLFSLALALKGIAYDQVPVNLLKDGGQQVRMQLLLVPPGVLNLGIIRRIGISTRTFTGKVTAFHTASL